MIVSAPTFGTTTLSGNVVTYIPNANFNGTDSFQFIANDGQYDSNTATVTLVVSAVNDAPYLYSIDNSTIILGEAFSYALQVEDADGDNLIYTVSVSGGSANANISGNTLTVEPQEANVTLNVVVTVTDGNTTHSIAFLIIVIQPQQTCLDNNHDINIVGTHLENDFIDTVLKNKRLHPGLNTNIPEGINLVKYENDINIGEDNAAATKD